MIDKEKLQFLLEGKENESFYEFNKRVNTFNVMKEYYDIESNNHIPIKLNEISVDNIINKHGNNGLIIISANRSDEDGQYNNAKTKDLIQDIKSSGFSYIPIYGGYRGKDNVVDSFEPSFCVVNFDRQGNIGDFNKLREFAIKMCGKYNQDSVLIKAPQEAPIYVDRNNKLVSGSSTNKVDKNDLNKEYFSSLIKTQNIDNKNPDRAKRWTYDINFECYINPSPCTLNERMRRSQGGEIIDII